jgi:hypothetical protein
MYPHAPLGMTDGKMLVMTDGKMLVMTINELVIARKSLGFDAETTNDLVVTYLYLWLATTLFK